MKIIRTERGKGKTTELIKQSARDWSYILCMNKVNAHHVFDMAREMGLDIPFPITPSDLPLRGLTCSVLIDEIDYILPTLIGAKVDTITTSSPIDTLDDKNTTRGLYKMYIADEVTIRDLDDNYIAETDNTEMAFRIVDLLTEQDLARIGSALLYALKDNEYCLASYKGNHLRSMKTVDDLLEWYDNVGRKL